MTAAEIIEIVDKAEPNMIDAEKKLRWLNDLDHKTAADLCPAGQAKEFPGYSKDDIDRELFIPEPYALNCYEPYLRSKIAADYMEINKYNQLAAMFNAAYQEFLNWHNRTFVTRRWDNRFKF